jgi:hypothetical protein
MSPVPSPGFIAGPDVPKEERALAKKKVQGWNRAHKLKTFSSGAERIGEALYKFPREMWKFKPSKEKWCIGEVLWHLADQEANLYIRLRRGVAESGGNISPYNQDKWAKELNYLKSDFDEAWHILRLLRRSNANLLKHLSAAAWKRKVKHPEWGNLSIEHLVGLNIWHLEHHLGQMARRYIEWKARNKKK